MKNNWKVGDLMKYINSRDSYITFGVIIKKGRDKNEFRVSWFDGGMPTTEFSDQSNGITNMSVSYGI